MDQAQTSIIQRVSKLVDIIYEEGMREGLRSINRSLKYNSYARGGIYKKYLSFEADNGLVRRTVDGHDMMLPITDPGLSLTLLLHGSREEEAVKIWQDILEPGMDVIEVGANLGFYTLKAASHIGESGKVYAFEPVPSNTLILQDNLKLNGCSNTRVIEQAVADENGEVEMKGTTHSNCGTIIMDDNNSFRSGFFERTQNITDDIIQVPATTLDSFTSDHEIDPDVIRMDIEGGELRAVEGMRQTLSNQSAPSYFLLETHTNFYENPEKQLRELFNPILKGGYQITLVELPDQIINNPDENEAISKLATCGDYSPHILFSKT